MSDCIQFSEVTQHFLFGVVVLLFLFGSIIGLSRGGLYFGVILLLAAFTTAILDVRMVCREKIDLPAMYQKFMTKKR